MATFSTTVKTFIESDAQFRAMFGFMRTMFTNFGWVQTSDTGQINPATATYPASNNTDAGYEIWRMDDSLQATYPVYIKMFYGRGSATGSFRWSIGIGTGSNGTGSLTGKQTSQTQFSVVPSPSTRPVTDSTTYRILGSGASGRVVWSFFPDVTVAPYGTFFGLERTKNSDGSDNGDGLVGFWFFFGGNNTSSNPTEWSQLSFKFSSVYTPSWIGSNDGGVHNVLRSTAGSVGATVRSNQDTASSLSDGKMWAWPFSAGISGQKYPVMNVLQVMAGDWPLDYSTVSFDYYGSAHVYIPLGLGPTQVNGPFRNGTQFSFLMRYE